MSELTSQFTSVLNSFWASGLVQTALIWGLGLLTILWLASAYWAFRDLEDRTENVVMPYLVSGLIILASPLFFLVAILFYKIVRPPERLGDIYERNLSEEALLAEVEEIKTCRTCDRRVDPAWIICPWCRNRLNRICPNCEEIVGLDWTICAWCGRDFERPAVVPVAETVPAAKTVSATESIISDWWSEIPEQPGEAPTLVPVQSPPTTPVEVAPLVEVAASKVVATPANVRVRKVRSNVPPTQIR
jgi:RNA polymerase subunit RPABC4/transcription elongation factor Spt4